MKYLSLFDKYYLTNDIFCVITDLNKERMVDEMKAVTKNVMKAHCGEIGMVLRIIFWIWVIWMAGMSVYGIWMLCHAASDFSVELYETGNGLVGLTRFRGGYELDFPVNVLDSDALQHPKLVFGMGYALGWIRNVLKLCIFWNLRAIFQNIDTYETPFMEVNATAIARIGVLLILVEHVKSALLPLLFMLCGIGSGGSGSMIDGNSLLFGGLIICLSYVFAYGTLLQQESDETL